MKVNTNLSIEQPEIIEIFFKDIPVGVSYIHVISSTISTKERKIDKNTIHCSQCNTTHTYSGEGRLNIKNISIENTI